LTSSATQTRELLGQRDLSYAEATTIIGKAVGKPDLKYLQLPDEQVRGAFLQMGISANVADLILEMAAALNSGYMKPLEERTLRTLRQLPLNHSWQRNLFFFFRARLPPHKSRHLAEGCGGEKLRRQGLAAVLLNERSFSKMTKQFKW